MSIEEQIEVISTGSELEMEANDKEIKVVSHYSTPRYETSGAACYEEQHEDDTAKGCGTLEQLLKLDAVHIPYEPTVDVYDPDGFLLCRTDDPIRFMRIRLGIKKLGLKGYTVKTGSGDVHEIAANGKVVDYPDGKLPGDIYGAILQELVM